ncbi:hypothetical protein TBLA_0B10130 [Henningerozyma blattae CBS 6284]|uniref:Mitochondrial carrier protein n=1 Tax=Henningerozyma blattae (strain ATCC 34711 / CBS 6284 / DSM 70876 / NBRC 10599 / NRRL Y-10934 / UCD 77-7) TaxID=1071380 RepID=I2H0C8_HENB6|nr:hypothetical protein TBLA_0B10130 [Tetrapisispora blattae CBS 6284]CCH59830.1 hypothetical protein TBLA_0B10130 [Tetrapisispora blattae CBS 6284]
MSDNKVYPLPFLCQFLAGAGAGMSETLVMYPLDVVKTRFQLQETRILSLGKNIEKITMMTCLSKIIRNESIKHLYKGMSSPILMEVPKRAVKFSCNDLFQNILMKKSQTSKANGIITLLSGTLAGLFESFIVVPFELVKIRLQDANSNYRSPSHCLRKTIENEGITSLYKGLEATVWRNSIWNASYFGLIYQVKKLMPTQSTNDKSVGRNFIAGTIAGCMSCFFSVPFDVIKTKIQVSKVSGCVHNSNWALLSVFLMYKKYGLRSIYRGIIPIICRYGPGGGPLLVSFNGFSELFKKIHQRLSN